MSNRCKDFLIISIKAISSWFCMFYPNHERKSVTWLKGHAFSLKVILLSGLWSPIKSFWKTETYNQMLITQERFVVPWLFKLHAKYIHVIYMVRLIHLCSITCTLQTHDTTNRFWAIRICLEVAIFQNDLSVCNRPERKITLKLAVKAENMRKMNPPTAQTYCLNVLQFYRKLPNLLLMYPPEHLNLAEVLLGIPCW